MDIVDSIPSDLSGYLDTFLKMASDESKDSAKGCRRFRDTKMPNGGEVLLAALKLHVRTKLRVTTFGTNHSVTDIT